MIDCIEYRRALGARLRSIRQQQGLSLQGVEEKSARRWKATVVGSYERGDRTLTVPRLAELADFYRVPVAEVLPERGGAPRGIDTPMRHLLGAVRDSAAQLLLDETAHQDGADHVAGTDDQGIERAGA